MSFLKFAQRWPQLFSSQLELHHVNYQPTATPYTDVDHPNDTTSLFHFIILLQENQAKTKQFLGNTTDDQWLWVNGAPRGLELFFYDNDLLECVIRCLKKVHDIVVIGVFSGLIRTWSQNQRGGE